MHKIGVVASKKIGNATKRNRAKRLLRAIFIKNIDKLHSGEFVLVAKPQILTESFISLNKSYLYALHRTTAIVSK